MSEVTTTTAPNVDEKFCAGGSAPQSVMKAVKLFAPVQIVDGKVASPEALVPQEVAIPELEKGEILVRVSRAAVNPSDLLTLGGHYGGASATHEEGTVPGFEGSGVVVKNNAGLLGWRLLNRRVAFVGNKAGSWGPFVAVPAKNCIPLPDNVSDDAGAYAFINPLTVIGFLEIATSGKHTSLVHTAGASALGKMLVRYAARKNVRVLSIVRRADQVPVVVAAGAPESDVLVSSDADFDSKMAAWCTANKTTLCFDAIGGTDTGRFLDNLPPKSTLYVYGLLSGKPSSNLSGNALVFQDKTVKGYWVVTHLGQKWSAGILMWQRTVSSLLATVLKTDVAGSYGADQAVAAIEAYSKTMTGGKICIAPNLPAGHAPLAPGESHPSDRPEARAAAPKALRAPKAAKPAAASVADSQPASSDAVADKTEATDAASAPTTKTAPADAPVEADATEAAPAPAPAAEADADAPAADAAAAAEPEAATSSSPTSDAPAAAPSTSPTAAPAAGGKKAGGKKGKKN